MRVIATSNPFRAAAATGLARNWGTPGTRMSSTQSRREVVLTR